MGKKRSMHHPSHTQRRNQWSSVALGILLVPFSVTTAQQPGGAGDPFLLEEQQQLLFQQQQQQQQPPPPQQQQTADIDPCIPCDGPIDQSLSFDGTTCPEWLDYARQVPANTEECALERVLGWKFCGCPAPGVTRQCTFCDDPDSLLATKTLPFSSITCDAFVNVPALDGDVTCQLTDDFAAYCGCSTATPQCTLCDDGGPPQHLDAPLYLGMTCADIHDLYLVSSETRCGDIAADYPFDLQSYCGCRHSTKPDAGCDFCPYQGTLRQEDRSKRLVSDETSTCGDWATLAEYAKEGASSCAVFQYVGLECCDGMQLPDFFTNYFEDNMNGDNGDGDGDVPPPPNRVGSEGPASTEQQQTAPGAVAGNPGDTQGVNDQTLVGGGGVSPDARPPQPDAAAAATSGHNPAAFGAVTQRPSTEAGASSSSALVDTSTAANINEAVRMCFQLYTTPLVAVNTLQVASVSRPNASLHAVNQLQQQGGGGEEMNQMFHQHARVSRTPMNLTTAATAAAAPPKPTSAESNANVDSAIQAGDQVHTKWEQLYKQLDHVSLPQGFGNMIPGDLATNTFLPGLPGCLESAVNQFAASESPCYLCDNGQEPLQPEKVIAIVGLYCDEYDAWRADATAEDCQSFDTDWLPFDMASYCGCPGVPDRAVIPKPNDEAAAAPDDSMEKCSFCPEGQVLILESWKHQIQDKSLLNDGGYVLESTCSEWSQMADYVTTPEACGFLQSIASSGCCEFIGESVLDKPPLPPALEGTTTTTTNSTTQPPNNTTTPAATETVSPDANADTTTASATSSSGAAPFVGIGTTAVAIVMTLLPWLLSS